MCNLFNTSGHVAAPEMQLQEKKNLSRHRRCQLRLVISLIMVMVGNKQKCNK